MNICYLSPNSHYGKTFSGLLPHDTYVNIIKAINGTMIPLEMIPKLIQKKELHTPDLSFFLFYKKKPEVNELIWRYIQEFPNVVVGIAQDGPINYFEEWSAHDQYNWLKILDSANFVFGHNQQDVEYLGEITRHHDTSYIIPTLYDDSWMPEPLPLDQRSGIMIMGCPGTWYNAMPPLKLCLDLGIERIGIPGMGRITPENREFFAKFPQITVHPWMAWPDWLNVLKTYRIGINLMSARAAGSFNLNCAALNIPCIGFIDLDVQLQTQPLELSLDRNYCGDAYKNLKSTIYAALEHTQKFIENDKRTYGMSLSGSNYTLQELASRYSIKNYSPKLKELFQDIYNDCSTRSNPITD